MSRSLRRVPQSERDRSAARAAQQRNRQRERDAARLARESESELLDQDVAHFPDADRAWNLMPGSD